MFISHIDYAMFISHIDYAILQYLQRLCLYRWYVVYAGCHTDGMSCTLVAIQMVCRVRWLPYRWYVVYAVCITRCFNNEKLVTALKKNNFTYPSENNKQI